MPSQKFFAIFLTFAIICSGQIVRSGESDGAIQPDATVLRVGNKALLLSELDKLARIRIWGQTGLTNTAVRQVRVRIYPRDQIVMCEITYTAGIGKPLSKVRIGYDGKILGVERVAFSHDTESKGDGAANETPVVIVSKPKEWGLTELDKLARNNVWGQTGPPSGAVRYTSVRIHPRDKTVMCVFTYSSGVFGSFWDVSIDYDGKVQEVRKGTNKH